MYITVLPSVLLAFATLSIAATTTTGPSGYVSIVSQPAYSTIRPCAAGCLWYTGSFACGVNKGYHDLAQELQCGCSAKNICYCGQNNLAPASAYISSCVSKGCSNFPGEVTAAISLLDGYCATANVEASAPAVAGSGSSSGGKTSVTVASTTQAQVGPTVATTTGVDRAGNTVTGTGSVGGQSAATGTGNGGQASPTSSANPEKKGLAQSDIIALAVGLGVGVPSLLLALATFCVQRRTKNGKSMALAG